MTPHILRHTFSYNYLEKTGNDLIGLATILGHDNVTTTQIYTQKPLGALQDEIEKVRFFKRFAFSKGIRWLIDIPTHKA